jgi:DNA-directed RNA polymerase specialized sigma24 family protein
MQDRELVAAVVAGGQDGLAEAYDRYAAPLYAYCRLILPGSQAPGEAASAVADAFVIAAVKLQGLRDPDQLRSWLHAVARNECLRRLGPPGRRRAPGGRRMTRRRRSFRLPACASRC